MHGGTHPEINSFVGLWDTGATGSVITRKVVDQLDLKPTSKAKIYHANGEAVVDVYYVNIFLPNQVGFSFIKVTEGKLTGADVLIGMDIISKGDFAISNFNEKTTFTFRVPSLGEIDFLNEKKVSTKSITEVFDTPQPAVSKKQGRNELCKCGSGKKYKYCHGKRSA